MEGPKVAIRGLNAVAALLAAKEAFLKKRPLLKQLQCVLRHFISLC